MSQFTFLKKTLDECEWWDNCNNQVWCIYTHLHSCSKKYVNWKTLVYMFQSLYMISERLCVYVLTHDWNLPLSSRCCMLSKTKKYLKGNLIKHPGARWTKTCMFWQISWRVDNKRINDVLVLFLFLWFHFLLRRSQSWNVLLQGFSFVRWVKLLRMRLIEIVRSGLTESNTVSATRYCVTVFESGGLDGLMRMRQQEQLLSQSD